MDWRRLESEGCSRHRSGTHISECAHIAPAGTGTGSLSAALHLTARDDKRRRAPLYLAHDHNKQISSVPSSRCFVMTLRDPAERLMSGFRHGGWPWPLWNFSIFVGALRSRAVNSPLACCKRRELWVSVPTPKVRDFRIRFPAVPVVPAGSTKRNRGFWQTQLGIGPLAPWTLPSWTKGERQFGKVQFAIWMCVHVGVCPGGRFDVFLSRDVRDTSHQSTIRTLTRVVNLGLIVGENVCECVCALL